MAAPLPFEPAPWFTAATDRNAHFAFASLGGRAVVLTFFGSGRHPAGRRLVADLRRAAEGFGGRSDDPVFCAVGFDRRDEDDPELRENLERLPHFVRFRDYDLAVAKLYGVVPRDAEPGGIFRFQPVTFLLDERLRVYAVIQESAAAEQVPTLLRLLAAMPRPGGPARQEAWAPVLAVPRIFEPALCRRLIEHYESDGGKPSGFMRDRAGRTIGVLDRSFKNRRDANVGDPGLRQAARLRIARRLLPEIERAFQFAATQIERDIVACYDAADGGYFRAHRDNTTRATRHRRFAVTINLNPDDYEGGDLRFPEYGPASYRATLGGAVVFSCSLLHEALPVTRGRRYCYLPFLYDAAAAEVRRVNQAFLDPRVVSADEKTVVFDPAAPPVPEPS